MASTLHQRNLKTLSLGRDKTVRADQLFEVFRTDGGSQKAAERKGPLPGRPGLSASQRGVVVSSSRSLDGEALDVESLGFSEDTSADPAVLQEMRKEVRQPAVLTKEEAEEASAWRVEGSSRAGFKVFRQVKEEEFQSDQGKRKKRSRSRRKSNKSKKDQFPDL